MHTSSSLLVLFLVGLLSSVSAIGRRQAISVKGRLMCHGQPMSGVLVKLYDEGVVWDTRMAKGYSSGNGEFHLSGTTTEMSHIDPKFNIYHKCETGWLQICPWKRSMIIPKQYIDSTFEVGSIELAIRPKGEDTDCFHRMARRSVDGLAIAH